MQDKQWGIIKHFKKEEFTCKCGCGFDDISYKLVLKLDHVRWRLNEKIVILSGCRCPVHNKAVGGVENSAHVKAMAADIVITNSRYRYKIMEGISVVGIKRLGMYKDFIHADIDKSKPQDVMWVY
jgi:uncharacterized protein YcbK (DUF882 family)